MPIFWVENKDDIDDPCIVCGTLSSNRRVVRIPKSGETYNDSECGYCGAIQRLFKKTVTTREFEEKFEKWVRKKFIRIQTLNEHESKDEIVIEFYRLL